MNMPLYYICEQCEGKFPSKDYSHETGLCKDCFKAKKDAVAKLHCSDGLSGLEIHIILDEKDPPNPTFVEIENKQGQSIGIGRREMMPCGLTRLVITVEDMIEKA